MSYQVLARKWRPKSFTEMAGQEHVLKALINALDQDRLHHAYLFTGTRGVGKTTIARILAKCLNCETGVSSQPCGTCSACVEINEGRFVDLIEVDAASRTKVEDTRELMDNVQYAPSRGRYKVYLIDEVHMLSMNSFNALLKTLEEPPPHVKFLLATTDPQKLPVTILSRCLQFNLKNLNPERIVEHLNLILDKEMIESDSAALWQLARSADGSMRDALSLTDQAIAYGNGKLGEQDVRSMLGTIDQHYVHDLLKALQAMDAPALLNTIEQMSEHNPDYADALKELLSALHRITIAQAVPDAIDNSFNDADSITTLASQFSAEDVQLFYQLAIHGQRDLPLAPEPRAGFEMVMLRMLAFKPQGIPELPSSQLKNSNIEDPVLKKPEPASTLASHNQPAQVTQTAPVEPVVKPAEKLTEKPITQQTTTGKISLSGLSPDNWHNVFFALSISGVVQNTAAHCVLDTINLSNDQSTTLHFTLDDAQAALFNPSHQERLASQLSDYFAKPLQCQINIGTLNRETPAAIQQRLQAERLAAAQQAFSIDPQVQAFVEHFDGQIILDSIKPLNHA